MADEFEVHTDEDHVFEVISPKKVSLRWGFASIGVQFMAATCMEAANTLAAASMMLTQRFLYENERTELMANAGFELEQFDGFEEEGEDG